MSTFSQLLPPRSNSSRRNTGGKVFGTAKPPKRFPRGRRGKRGPFSETATIGPMDFEQLVAHYVGLIGYKVECLNGLQFNVRQGTAPGVAQQISDALGSLADALEVGSTVFKKNPKELRWPLAGSYTMDLPTKGTNFKSITIDLYFDTDPIHRFVVNCTIGVQAEEEDGDGAGDSNSSIYINTSSKGG